jgi:hypothetical protein
MYEYKEEILKKSAQMRNFASNVSQNSENAHKQKFLYKSPSKVFPKAALKVYYGIFLAIIDRSSRFFS